jgi:hypothetical protein
VGLRVPYCYKVRAIQLLFAVSLLLLLLSVDLDFDLTDIKDRWME